MYVTLSSEVSPRIREFARTSTTIMNAQVGPRLRTYLTPLQELLEQFGLKGPLLVMQSEGGTITADRAPEHAITTVGSVLSGGVVGGMRLAAQLGHRNVITTDVGGTTFLAGLIVEGQPVMAPGSIVNQFPINAATIRVHTIGAGGGALASVDAGGNLRLGPQSAEAVPGPACAAQSSKPDTTPATSSLTPSAVRGPLTARATAKIWGGVLQRDVADAWIRRSRLPHLVGLDLRAKIAANKNAAEQILRLIAKYGADTVKAVMRKMMDDAERRLRAKLGSPWSAWLPTR